MGEGRDKKGDGKNNQGYLSHRRFFCVNSLSVIYRTVSRIEIRSDQTGPHRWRCAVSGCGFLGGDEGPGDVAS
jgi:hypothetical protein